MEQVFRKTIAVFCFLMLMLIPCQTVFASDMDMEYPVAPMMTYIDDYWLSISIDGNTANVEASVDGDVLYATRTKVIAELQVKSGNNWIPVAIWTADEDFYTARIDETHDVVDGHTYRVKGTFMVWEGSASETEMSYTDEITA